MCSRTDTTQRGLERHKQREVLVLGGQSGISRGCKGSMALFACVELSSLASDAHATAATNHTAKQTQRHAKHEHPPTPRLTDPQNVPGRRVR